MQFRNWQKSPSRTRFSEPETYRNSVKLGGRFLDDPRGLATYLKRPRGTPRAPQVAALAFPSRSTTLRPNPSSLLLLLLPQRLRRSPAGDLHHHRHHAVMLAGFRGGSTTSAARWNGEEDVVFINTVRVTEYGGAARLWHRQVLLRAFASGQDLLRAFASGK